jgi:chemotaxis protein MotB
MRQESEKSFARVAQLIRQYNCDIRVEGHTDNVPIHTSQFASNWELSTARATEVIRKLILQYGFAPDRLSAAGYAEFHPTASNETDEGRRVNRRVDLVILGGGRSSNVFVARKPETEPAIK